MYIINIFSTDFLSRYTEKNLLINETNYAE